VKLESTSVYLSITIKWDRTSIETPQFHSDCCENSSNNSRRTLNSWMASFQLIAVGRPKLHASVSGIARGSRRVNCNYMTPSNVLREDLERPLYRVAVPRGLLSSALLHHHNADSAFFLFYFFKRTISFIVRAPTHIHESPLNTQNSPSKFGNPDVSLSTLLRVARSGRYDDQWFSTVPVQLVQNIYGALYITVFHLYITLLWSFNNSVPWDWELKAH
jgi:hypothetical protein